VGNQLNWIKSAIIDSLQTKTKLLEDATQLESINKAATLIANACADKHKIIFAGNGGSAADAQHLAAELVSRYQFNRPGLPSMSLSTDTSIITAIGNDYGYEFLFSRQIEAQANKGDIFIGISTSGKSKNIIEAFKRCKSNKIFSIALCGLDGELDKYADLVIRVPSHSTPRIQECHILIGHMICEFVEKKLFSSMDFK
jgi:D-sedoheptulose 7-phosphate isomerase